MDSCIFLQRDSETVVEASYFTEYRGYIFASTTSIALFHNSDAYMNSKTKSSRTNKSPEPSLYQGIRDL